MLEGRALYFELKVASINNDIQKIISGLLLSVKTQTSPFATIDMSIRRICRLPSVFDFFNKIQETRFRGQNAKITNMNRVSSHF